MGAVEHLKTLCCLGLPPESAMVAVTPLLHEIVPHGWSRFFYSKRMLRLAAATPNTRRRRRFFANACGSSWMTRRLSLHVGPLLSRGRDRLDLASARA